MSRRKIARIIAAATLVVDAKIFAAFETQDVRRRRRAIRDPRRLQRRIIRSVRDHQQRRRAQSSRHPFDALIFRVSQSMMLHVQQVHFRSQPLALVIVPIERSARYHAVVIRLRPSGYLVMNTTVKFGGKKQE